MSDSAAIHRKEYEMVPGKGEQLVVAFAPGRLHLLGEHTESCDGLFLSVAINRHIEVAVSLRKDSSLRFFASDLGERKRTTLVNLKYKREDRWANFIKVAIHGFAERGFPVKGLNFTVCGDIPQQVGLASSSAIEIASAIALRELFAPSMTGLELLDLLDEASLGFFGRVGSSVDHLLALGAKQGEFIIIDSRDRSVRSVKSPFSGYRMLLTDSRVPRFGVEGELKQRRQDIKRSLELLSKKYPARSLRDIETDDLVESMGSLPEELRRRAMHVVEEARRVREAEECMRKGDLSNFAKIIYHSHESLRDLFEVSCPEIDWLVKRSQELEGVLCARITGQGFGGCTYAIVAEDSVEEYYRRLEEYERIFGFKPIIHEVEIASAAGISFTERPHANFVDQ